MRRMPLRSKFMATSRPDREQRLAERAARAVAYAADCNFAPNGDFRPAAQLPKSDLVRSPAYRRAVASLPCKYCGIPGFSQCAHSNTGKGMGIKASDLDSFPLCADRPGQRGCHSRFDQGALLDKAARKLMEPAWVADTQRQIYAMGLWPTTIPYPQA